MADPIDVDQGEEDQSRRALPLVLGLPSRADAGIQLGPLGEHGPVVILPVVTWPYAPSPEAGGLAETVAFRALTKEKHGHSSSAVTLSITEPDVSAGASTAIAPLLGTSHLGGDPSNVVMGAADASPRDNPPTNSRSGKAPEVTAGSISFSNVFEQQASPALSFVQNTSTTLASTVSTITVAPPPATALTAGVAASSFDFRYSTTAFASGSFQVPTWLSPSLSNSGTFEGISLSGSISGGLRGSLSYTTGSSSLDYPLSVNAQIPTSVADGNSFTFDTSNFSVSGASLNLIGPGLTSSLELFFQGNLNLRYAGVSLVSFNPSYDYFLPTSTTIGGLTIAVPGGFTATSGPQSANGSLPSLSAFGHGSPFLSGSLDVAQLLADLYGFPLSGSFSIPLVGTFGYDLLSAEIWLTRLLNRPPFSGLRSK